MALTLVFYQATKAQYLLFTNTCNSGGYFYQNEKYKLSNNIGEMSLVNILIRPQIMITHGVLQPLRMRTTMENYNGPMSVRLYPTIITKNLFYLETKTTNPINIMIRIFSIDGKLISQENIPAVQGVSQNMILASRLNSGFYIAEVLITKTNTLDGAFKKSYKIFKP
jgi:hypothetical protein